MTRSETQSAGRPRIGVTQRVEVVAEYGEVRDCLDQAWTSLLDSVGLTIVPLPNAVELAEEYLVGLDLDGVILTGGNDLEAVADPDAAAPERDRFERTALTVAREQGWPVLGVCRGLQLANVHYGGSVGPVEGHVATEHSVRFEQDIDGIRELPTEMIVNSYHDYGIRDDQLAEPLRPVAVAHDGSIEAATHPDWDFVAVMWHPERGDRREVDVRILERLFGQGGAR
jgi:gamma-glutamyl-gamma-aminobutyrate hydrolase PuuD